MDWQARGQRRANPLELGLVQLPTRPTSIYTQSMRRTAIEACENGNLRLAADLTLAAITESAYCRGILADLVEGLWGLPRHWTGRADMIAELDDTPERVGQFATMFPQPDAIRMMSWGITLGVGPGQMRRKYGRPGDAYPISPDEAANWQEVRRQPRRPIGAFDTRVLHAWSPKYLRYQWWDDSWWMMSADGEFRIDPLDDAPTFDEHGNVTEEQQGNPDEWLMYMPYGRHRPWEWGAWKSATQAFVFERDASFDRSRHAEVLAPMRVGSVPSGTTERQRKKYLQQIKEMQRMGILFLPPGLDYKIVESTGRVTQVYADMITSAHQEYAMITGAVTTAEGNKGFAKGDVQERFTRGILSSFGNSLAMTLWRGGIVPWAREGWGGDGDDAPRPGWDAVAPEDKKARAETLKTAGEALVSVYEGAALAGVRPTKQSSVKYLQSLGFEAEDIPINEAKAAKIDLAPSDKAAAFRVWEVRAGEGYPKLGTLDDPDPRDDLTMAEMKALEKPAGTPGAAPPGGNHGDVTQNQPLAVDDSVDPNDAVSNEQRAALAAKMTEYAVERCGHERVNRCLLCGIERARDFTPDPVTGAVAWHVAWRPILRGTPPTPAVAVLAASGLRERVYAGIRVVIDRPRGFVQTGTGKDGAAWERTYQVDYGFIEGTRGGDRGEFDVFCGPDRYAPQAFVAAQTDDSGRFDEYKLFLGFVSLDAARACYVAHIPAQMLAGMFALPVEALRGFLGLEPRPRNALALNGSAHSPAWSAPGGEA